MEKLSSEVGKTPLLKISDKILLEKYPDMEAELLLYYVIEVKDTFLVSKISFIF